MKNVLVCLFLVFIISLSGCSNVPGAAQKPVQVATYWIRPAALQGNTAAFMVIKNTSNQPDQLIKAETIISNQVVLMDTQMKDGKMQMMNVDAIKVPANGQVELKSGSFHIMLMGLRRDLKDGDKVQITLTFEKAGAIQLDVPVVQPASPQ